MGKKSVYEKYIKRFFDLFLSLIGIIILSPVLLVVALLVKLKLGSPVLFKQERPGYKENIFTVYKFRTMKDDVDSEGNILPDEERLTKFGRLLRSTSLDELPELFNILSGSMSIIGPRPLLVRYLPLYTAEENRRHDVRPGITGYAQVNGRNSLSWEEKFKLDIYYVDNISAWLDLKIFFKTIATVIKRDGITSDSSSTMEEFKR